VGPFPHVGPLTGSWLHPWQVLAQSLCFALESKHHLGLLPSPCTAVFDLLTCKQHILLGPCFNTGREWHCCAKLHCFQNHKPTGGPAAWLSLRSNNQSTGQKSLHGTRKLVPSQSCVSIKQSDSPAKQHFQISNSVDTRMNPRSEGHVSPATEKRGWMAEPSPQMTEATH
jgi:hypothetical protein